MRLSDNQNLWKHWGFYNANLGKFKEAWRVIFCTSTTNIVGVTINPFSKTLLTFSSDLLWGNAIFLIFPSPSMIYSLIITLVFCLSGQNHPGFCSFQTSTSTTESHVLCLFAIMLYQEGYPTFSGLGWVGPVLLKMSGTRAKCKC